MSKNPRLIDLAGSTWGRWSVLSKAGNTIGGAALWLCRCSCGEQRAVIGSDLRKGKSTSCGCLKREMIGAASRTHGESRSRLHTIWKGMLSRCRDKNRTGYGAAGIGVFSEWSDFSKFRDWAMSNGYSDSLSIERKDSLGDYSPQNCKWATATEQSRNRSIVRLAPDGRLWSDIAKENGISNAAFKCRLSAGGWPVELAATWPLGVKRQTLPRDDIGRYVAPKISTWRRKK